MGKIMTISVDEKAETVFRERAYRKFGRRKGAISKALSMAMLEWGSSDEADEGVVAQALELMKTGVKMKKWRFNRDELHER